MFEPNSNLFNNETSFYFFVCHVYMLQLHVCSLCREGAGEEEGKQGKKIGKENTKVVVENRQVIARLAAILPAKYVQNGTSFLF